ncbi:hypothetical protein CRX72_22600 [Pantoea sp. BRM17]|nr:hypothetical protein CRX72_22600 [Pantoea sp. BRM17]
MLLQHSADDLQQMLATLTDTLRPLQQYTLLDCNSVSRELTSRAAFADNIRAILLVRGPRYILTASPVQPQTVYSHGNIRNIDTMPLSRTLKPHATHMRRLFRKSALAGMVSFTLFITILLTLISTTATGRRATAKHDGFWRKIQADPFLRRFSQPEKTETLPRQRFFIADIYSVKIQLVIRNITRLFWHATSLVWNCPAQPMSSRIRAKAFHAVNCVRVI